MVGQKIVQKLSSPETQQQAQCFAKSFFKSTFGVLGDLYVVLFLGIFVIQVLTRTKQIDVQVMKKRIKKKNDVRLLRIQFS